MKKVLYIFGQLTDEDIEWLIDNGELERFKAGSVIIENGRQIDKLYIGLDGKFSVLRGIDDEIKVAELGAGEILGEMSFVDSSPPSATVKVDQDAHVYSIPRDSLKAKIESDKGFASRFYHAIAIFLADRLRSVVSNLGYGDARYSVEAEPELNALITDSLSAAGDRFQRMLARMMAK